MTLMAFAIRDMVADRYLEPFFTINTNTALRSFQSACQNIEDNLSKYPDDYSLYLIGEWDSIQGALIGKEPVRIARATDFTQPTATPADLPADPMGSRTNDKITEAEQVRLEGRA